MTVTLNLKPEVESGLVTPALASGMTIEEYVLSVVESAVLRSPQQALSGDQRAAAFEAWAKGHRSDTQLLSNYGLAANASMRGAIEPDHS